LEIRTGRLFGIDVGESYRDRFVLYCEDNTSFNFWWSCVSAMNTQDCSGYEVVLTKFLSDFLWKALPER